MFEEKLTCTPEVSVSRKLDVEKPIETGFTQGPDNSLIMENERFLLGKSISEDKEKSLSKDSMSSQLNVWDDDINLEELQESAKLDKLFESKSFNITGVTESFDNSLEEMNLRQSGASDKRQVTNFTKKFVRMIERI